MAWGRRLSPFFAVLIIGMMLHAAVWAGILQLELFYASSDGTYGTDETFYWNSMLSVLHGQAQVREQLASPFIGLGVQVLSAGTTESVFWIRLMNVLMYGLALSLVYIMMRRRLGSFALSGTDIGSSRLFDLVFLIYFANPILIWTVIRGLKETMFILILAACLFAFDYFNSSRRSVFSPARYPGLVVGLALAPLLSPLRSQSQLLVMAGFASNFLVWHVWRDLFRAHVSRRQWITRRFVPMLLVVGLGSLIALVVWTPNAGYVMTYRELFAPTGDAVTEALLRSGPLTFPLSVARFVLGPGPPNALRQLIYGDAFEVSAFIGDVLILLGSFHWWLMLLLFGVVLAGSLKRGLNILLANSDYLVIALIFIATYSFIYLGTGDTRHRAVMYFLLGPVIVPVLSSRWRNVLGSARGKTDSRT